MRVKITVSAMRDDGKRWFDIEDVEISDVKPGAYDVAMFYNAGRDRGTGIDNIEFDLAEGDIPS